MMELIKNILPSKLSWLVSLGAISFAAWLFSEKEVSQFLVSGFGLAGYDLWLLVPLSAISVGLFLVICTLLYFIGQKVKLPKNYSRKKIAEGNFAFIPSEVEWASDATHKLCASCFEQGRPSTLSQTREPQRMIGLVCPNGCPKLVFTHYKS